MTQINEIRRSQAQLTVPFFIPLAKAEFSVWVGLFFFFQPFPGSYHPFLQCQRTTEVALKTSE